MTKTIEIDGRTIGEGEPCYLIAEVGTTCMGNIDRAKQLIDSACAACMDAVKFQVIDPYQDIQDEAEYRVVWDGIEQTVNMRKMFEALSMSRDEWGELISYCSEENITFLATCDFVDGINMLEDLGISAHKIGAWDTTYKDLIDVIGRTGKPMIVDLGPTSQQELTELVSWYTSAGGSSVIPLHDYHTSIPKQMNMHAITHLSANTDGPVGYSSPNTDSDLDFVALALGAHVIEKRLIMSRNDHVLHAHESLEPDELITWSEKIRNAEAALGRVAIIPSDNDLAGARKYYRSIVAARDIAKGTIIAPEDLDYKRPGTGIAPKNSQLLIGKSATRDLTANTLLSADDFK